MKEQRRTDQDKRNMTQKIEEQDRMAEILQRVDCDRSVRNCLWKFWTKVDFRHSRQEIMQEEVNTVQTSKSHCGKNNSSFVSCIQIDWSANCFPSLAALRQNSTRMCCTYNYFAILIEHCHIFGWRSPGPDIPKLPGKKARPTSQFLRSSHGKLRALPDRGLRLVLTLHVQKLSEI